MPSRVVLDILRHTPLWVWGVLALLVVVGRRQLQDQAVGRVRVVALPLAMMAWSLASAASAFGAQAPVALAWGVGVALALVIGRMLPSPVTVADAPDGRVVLAGSRWPLVGMLAIFALRYATGVGLALDPHAADGALGPTMAALYGAMSGAFAVRALRCLEAAGTHSRALAAA